MAEQFNSVQEINNACQARTLTVTSKPVTAEAFTPVEAKKKRLGSFFMSLLSSDEEAEYEPEPPTEQFDFKASEAKWAVINKARLWAPRFGPYYRWKIDYNLKTRGVEAASETLEIAISEALRDEAEKAGSYPPPPLPPARPQQVNKRRRESSDVDDYEEDFNSQKRDLEREISDLKRKLEYDRGYSTDTSQCQLCIDYEAELKATEPKKSEMGRHWYAKTRNKINGRWKTHTKITHAAAEQSKQKLKEAQIKLNQLYRDRVDKKEQEERKRRREEKDEEERKRQEEDGRKRRF